MTHDSLSPVPGRAPTVLIASAQVQLVRWLGAVLERLRYAVHHAATGPQAVERARVAAPDAILLDTELPDTETADLCRMLHWEPRVGPYTPILILGPTLTRAQRLGALRAGAWDALTTPLDQEELAIRLGLYTRLKQAAELGTAESLVDPETGLYNMQGLARRAREFGALAARQRAALACLVIMPEVPAPPGGPQQVVARCAQLLQSVTRASDALGRVSPTELAVVAPGTNAEGALQLTRRLGKACEELARAPGEPSMRLRVGFDAVPVMTYEPTNAIELMGRATIAERQVSQDPRGGWIRAYGETRNRA